MRVASLCMAVWRMTAGGNDMFSFGLMALPERGAAARRPEQTVARQMGLPQ